jgi:DNA-binding response OmpR family regulator
MNAAPITILVVDNAPDTLSIICDFLEGEGFQTIKAGSRSEGKRLIELGNNIQLVVTDMRLINEGDARDISGIELAKETRADIPKIIYSQWPSYETAREALGARIDGLPPAVDFVAKYDGLQPLLTAVRNALMIAGTWKIARENNQPDVLGTSEAQLDVKNRQLIVKQNKIELTPGEFNLMYYFFLHPNEVVSHEVIVMEVLKETYNEFFDKNRINNMIHRLREKLEDNEKQEFLQTVRGHGFKLAI